MAGGGGGVAVLGLANQTSSGVWENNLQGTPAFELPLFYRVQTCVGSASGGMEGV